MFKSEFHYAGQHHEYIYIYLLRSSYATNDISLVLSFVRFAADSIVVASMLSCDHGSA